eukprot:2290294-Pleurochrysis_carterae.AAC.3
MKGEKGECRPARRYTDKFQDTHWLKYERILQERVNKIQEKMGSKKRSDKLRIIHNELTKVAAEVAGEVTEMRGAGEEEMGGYNHREVKELNKEQGFQEKKKMKSSNGSDTCTTLGDIRGAKEKKGGSGGEKRSDTIT